MSIIGNMIGGYGQSGKTFIIVDENNNEFTGIVVDKEQIFDAMPSDVKAGKVFANNDGVQVGTAVIGSDGSNVTFGYVNNVPAEREFTYVITSERLNKLGFIAQKMSGRTKLMTVDEIIALLQRVEYVPQGNAESSLAFLDYSSLSIGRLPDVQHSTATSAMKQLYITTSAVGVL